MINDLKTRYNKCYDDIMFSSVQRLVIKDYFGGHAEISYVEPLFSVFIIIIRPLSSPPRLQQSFYLRSLFMQNAPAGVVLQQHPFLLQRQEQRGF